MDYTKLIDSFRGVACVITVTRSKDGGADTYSVAAANRNYLASVGRQDEAFVPNRPYTDYISHDANFEALVSACISDGKISHQYVNAGLYNAWLDLYMLPLLPDENGNGCCLFTYEMNRESDSDKMIDISAKTAYMVLRTCLKFRENYDFRGTLDSIVRDIRGQCESDGCAVILTDKEKRLIDITGSIGAVFVDVNGLKTANDSKGHDEGDEMLKSVASKIKSVYNGEEIYRVGGDEFLVLIAGVGKEEFDARFEKLRLLSRLNGEATFALGAHYEEDGGNISRIMHAADQNMYKNKAEFYEANPDLSRRMS